MLLVVNGADRETTEGTTVGELLAQLGVPARPGVAVAVNGEVVPRSTWAGVPLATGDQVELVGAVQGG